MEQTPTKYLAHSKNRAGQDDTLRDHLLNVAKRASEFAESFGATEEAKLAGLLHDLGKYGYLFQRRLSGKEQGIDHWSAGAWEALLKYKQKGIATALAIQGHHIGLQDASKDSLLSLNPIKLKDFHPLGLRLSEDDISRLIQFLQEDAISLPAPEYIPDSIYEGLQAPPGAAMLDIRMLYSVLVDADFIETEAHFQVESGRKQYRETGPPLEADLALPQLITYINNLKSNSNASPSINTMRNDLLQACMDAATLKQGLFTLSAPTGTGKTLSMLAFGLKHALENCLNRIIMVIPYLNIIDQTAQEYRKVFAPMFKSEFLGKYILEHHSLSGTRDQNQNQHGQVKDMEDEPHHEVELLTENWDAPIVITTSVQLLESLFANRPSACRKLHRLAKSVIFFDEVQTIPTSLAVPTLSALSHLSKRYNTTVVFSTATQPAFTHLNNLVKNYSASGWEPKEIVPQSLNLFQRERRTRIEWPQDLNNPMPWAELEKQLDESIQALCIVNLKRHALRLFDALESSSSTENLFHLSTSMCPAHREKVLKEVRRRLDNNLPCKLVSTQCVEAGVDIDFPIVFRALGPMDAIAQASGRCNRNGKMNIGRVVVFLPEDESYPDGAYRQAASVTRLLLTTQNEDNLNTSNPELFTKYYSQLYDLTRPENMRKELLNAIKRQDFVEVNRQYRLIPRGSINVLVPYNLKMFNHLVDIVRQTALTARWIRQARPYTIGIFRPRPEDPIWTYLDPAPIGRGHYSDEWFIYLKQEHYKLKTGLVPPTSMESLIG